MNVQREFDVRRKAIVELLSIIDDFVKILDDYDGYNINRLFRNNHQIYDMLRAGADIWGDKPPDKTPVDLGDNLYALRVKLEIGYWVWLPCTADGIVTKPAIAKYINRKDRDVANIRFAEKGEQ